MPRYKCLYCGTHLLHNSLSVRQKHNAGKKHREHVSEYWQNVITKTKVPGVLVKGSSSKPLFLDQTRELQVFKVPGLAPEKQVNEALDKSQLPSPVNLSTSQYPHSYL